MKDMSGLRHSAYNLCCVFNATVADLEGVQGVRLNPPLETDYFIFMENFKTFCVK